ncbi:RluA family pseudouridine synthase, partial [Candidatus Ichthyocystis hellenicum]|uniref:RluA family pseudouridine synthase n=1 Tax=Candidatus Ichthyocystis hellenicum TaxID=1561003 RepID=UPI000A8CF794
LQYPMNKIKHPSKTLTVQEEGSGQRLDNYLSRITKRQLPRSRIHHMIRSGEVRVNQHRCSASTKLTVGDRVRIPPFFAKEQQEHNPHPAIVAQFSKDIIYEDNSLLAINKPSGLACHGGSGISLGLIEHLRILRPHQKFLELVHRLDRDTSGIVLIAKKKTALIALHTLFRDHEIDKRYIALIKGKFRNSYQRINLPLSTKIYNNEKKAFIDKINGKESTTEVFLLLRGDDSSLVEVHPLSGRTHQIRAHLSTIGHPILGDKKYNPVPTTKKLLLHAHRISFHHPLTEQIVTLSSPIPKEFILYAKRNHLKIFTNSDHRALLSTQQLVDMIESVRQ